MMNNSKTEKKTLQISSLFVFILIFILNDFLFMMANNDIAFLLIDYVLKVAILIACIYLYKRQICNLEDFGFVKIGLKSFIFWTILLSISGVIIDQVGWRFFYKILPRTELLIFPIIENKILRTFDLIFGLILVGVIEELVFRGYFKNVVGKYIENKLIIIILSSIIFGICHWGAGLHAICTTTVWGILPMIMVIREKSIYPAIIAHYMTDFFGFSQIIPNKWFGFLY